ncbi:MAG: LPS export ABC transporter permease LptG [Steroidobacteraceae bacterium]
MGILDRYIIRTLLGGVALVMSVVVTLNGLFLFISQQDDIGTGTYSAVNALWYVLLNIPEQAFEMLPIGALIGGLVGLGQLARNSELTVLRASGLSVLRIARSVALGGLVLVAIALLIGEWLAPTLGQMARDYKAIAKFSNVSFAGQGGAWIRDGEIIIKAEQQSGAGEYGGLMVFDLSPDNRVLGIGRATSATAQPDGHWQLRDYAESRFEDERVVARVDAQRDLESGVSAGFLGVAAKDPMSLSIRTLYGLIDYLRGNRQDVRSYVFAFWSRVARTVGILFATLQALPFVFGSLRAAGAGARTTFGLVLGVGYFLLQRMVENGTFAFNLDPALLAWLPTALLAAITIGLLARVR